MSELDTPVRGRLLLGCDIGGTFTDFIVYDEEQHSITTHKILTTPSDPSDAFMQGVTELAARQPQLLRDVRHVIHGTTLVINAVIERKGAKTALVTTSGFRDILEMRRHRRSDVYDIRNSPPRPLVARDSRYEVRERTYGDGRILEPVDEGGLRRLAAELRKEKVESVAVSFLHSYVNSSNEERALAILQEELPGVSLSVSHKVLPEMKEFERTSTTVVNAYTQPLISRYLDRLGSRLAEAGSKGPLLLMHSGGGVVPRAAAAQFPVRLIESGPVAGVLAAARIGQQVGHTSVLAYDMGGTTAKACLIKDGHVPITSEFEVDRVLRFRRGSGTPVGIPAVDLVEIGAGGGSIAALNDRGLLSVGPQSAGADPGPICYGRGGTQPTVTDADLLLGYFDPTYFLGGKMPLQRDSAAKGVETLGGRLELSVFRCAWGIHDLVNETMAAAARMHLAERGCDPRQVAMIAFGGAGPLHAYGVARKLGVPRVIVPYAAGVVSALGMLIAPVSYNVARSYPRRLIDIEPAALDKLWKALQADAVEVLEQAERGALITFEYALDVRYSGQGSALTLHVPAPMGELPKIDIAEITKAFLAAYKDRYGYAYSDTPLAVARLRLTARIGSKWMPVSAKVPDSQQSLQSALKGKRKAFSPTTQDWDDFAVYDRYRLPVGASFTGPAIVEEAECTTLVGPQVKASVHADGHLILDMPETP